MQKISPKMVNPRDIAGNAEEEEEENWQDKSTPQLEIGWIFHSVDSFG